MKKSKDTSELFPEIPVQLPARLTGAQTAALTGFQPHDIRVLILARLLKPLGNPTAYAITYFSAAEIQALASDRSWLSKATNALYQYSLRKNHRKGCEIAESKFSVIETQLHASNGSHPSSAPDKT